MDPVSKLGRALAVVRRAASARKPSSSAQGQVAARGEGPPRQPVTDAQLRTEIARQLGALNPNDPNRRDVSAKVFLEQVLLRELGPDLLTSQRLQSAIRDVQQVMDADPAVRAEFDALLEEMANTGRR